MMELSRKGFWDFDEDWLNGVLNLNSWLRSAWHQYNGGRLCQPILDQWPAQEFFRAYPRAVHRDWISRWTKAGGHLYNGKMIALKDDPIWYALSDFQLPFPPVAPDSGMDVRDIDRGTAMKLGLIDRDRQVSLKEVARPGLILFATNAPGERFTVTAATHVYEVRPRKDQRGVDLISDALPFGGLWYGEPNAISNAIGYAKFYSRSHHAVIRVFDEAGNIVKTEEHAGDFREPGNPLIE